MHHPLSRYEEMVDVNNGSISREIFVDDGIYAEELEKVFARVLAAGRP